MSGGDAARVRLAVVGGGMSAASLAVQLMRRATVAVDITVIEPRQELGRGLAYSARDRDHRLNAPLDVHGLDPARPEELREWFDGSGLAGQDPEGCAPGGHVFARRELLGAYFSEQVRRAADECTNGCTLRHVRDWAVGASSHENTYTVVTSSSGPIAAQVLVVATGNPPPQLRPPFAPAHAAHPRIVGNPLEPGCLDGIPADASVLVVGGGLTALDIVSTLLRRGHHGGIRVISRRGLRPRAHAPQILGLAPVDPGKAAFFDPSAPIPPFMLGVPPTARAWTRALREEIAKVTRSGGTWHEPVDRLRDAVRRLWPQLPLREQLRILRRLRVFYDVHRFRTPPMNDAMVRAAEAKGWVRFDAASLAAVEAASDAAAVRVSLVRAVSPTPACESFDFVVNCTGLDAGAAWRTNPFLHAMVEAGLLRVHGTSLGFDVGPDCEAIDAAGLARPSLRVIGPPTAGVFGEPLGIAFIAGQVARILPDLLRTIEGLAAANRASASSGDRSAAVRLDQGPPVSPGPPGCRRAAS